jgi:hypothetical protein
MQTQSCAQKDTITPYAQRERNTPGTAFVCGSQKKAFKKASRYNSLQCTVPDRGPLVRRTSTVTRIQARLPISRGL